MKRGYDIDHFKRTIRTLNEEFSNIKLRTQLMVGFPGETEEEFQDTYKLLDELRFDFTEVYLFQPRPGTKAAQMENQIPPKIARMRFCKLFLKTIYGQRKRKKRSLNYQRAS